MVAGGVAILVGLAFTLGGNAEEAAVTDE